MLQARPIREIGAGLHTMWLSLHIKGHFPAFKLKNIAHHSVIHAAHYEINLPSVDLSMQNNAFFNMH